MSGDDSIKKTLAQHSPPKSSGRAATPVVGIPGTVGLEIGAEVGNFVVERLLGQGAMGAVYLGAHKQLNRQVAIKVLQPQIASSSQLVDRFVDEAKLVSELGHPGIAQIFDFGTLPDGNLYTVMEYLQGRDLHEVLVDSGPLPVDRVATIGVQVCAALSAVHDRSIIHRDLKPANLFATTDEDGNERIKILDFGIAKLDSPAGPGRTLDGHIVGTPEYMSPEQAHGAGNVGASADIYSLGCVLYELLLGRPPFEASTLAGVLLAQVSETPVPLSARGATVPPALEAIIMRCLAKDPTERFPSVRELRDALLPFARTESAEKFPTVGGTRALASAIAPTVLNAPATPLPGPSAAAVQSLEEKEGRSWLLPAVGAVVLAAAVITLLASREEAGEPTAGAAMTTDAASVSEITAFDATVEEDEPKKNPYTRDNGEALGEGAAIFASHCASCHGKTGKGDGALTPVGAVPKAFTHMKVAPGVLDTYRYGVVRRGIGQDMPSFARKLSPDESWKVVTFLSYLGDDTSHTPMDNDEMWTIQAPELGAEQVQQGEAVYAMECESCHGRKGRGNGRAARYLGRTPTDLTRGVFKLRTTDADSVATSEDLYRTLERGMGIQGMPSFSSLSTKDKWAVVAYVRTLSERFAEDEPKAIAIPKPPEFTPDHVERGRKNYDNAGCDNCHGMDGRGDGPEAANLKTDMGQPIKPTDLSDAASYIGGTTPREIYRTMMTGPAGTPMPAGETFFDEKEAWDVVAYILSLQH